MQRGDWSPEAIDDFNAAFHGTYRWLSRRFLVIYDSPMAWIRSGPARGVLELLDGPRGTLPFRYRWEADQGCWLPRPEFARIRWFRGRHGLPEADAGADSMTEAV